MEQHLAGEGKVPTPVGSVGGESDSGIFSGLNCMQVCSHRVLTDSERFEREKAERRRQRERERERAPACAHLSRRRTRAHYSPCAKNRAAAEAEGTRAERSVWLNLAININRCMFTLAGMPCDGCDDGTRRLACVCPVCLSIAMRPSWRT